MVDRGNEEEEGEIEVIGIYKRIFGGGKGDI